MAPALIPRDLTQRLSKLCGLFGSEFDGERANAARMADDLIRGFGLTWKDVIWPGHAEAGAPLQARHEPRDHQDAARMCLRFAEALSEWERGFCRSVLGFTKLSEKQQRVLYRLVEKAQEFAQTGQGRSDP